MIGSNRIIGTRVTKPFVQGRRLTPALRRSELSSWVLSNDTVTFVFTENKTTGVHLEKWKHVDFTDYIYNKAKSLWQLNIIRRYDHSEHDASTLFERYDVSPDYLTFSTVESVSHNVIHFKWNNVIYDHKNPTHTVNVTVTAKLLPNKDHLDLTLKVEANQSYTAAHLTNFGSAIISAIQMPAIAFQKSDDDTVNEASVLSVPIGVGHTITDPIKNLRTPRYDLESFHYDPDKHRVYHYGQPSDSSPKSSIYRSNYGSPGWMSMPIMIYGNRTSREGTMIYCFDEEGTNAKGFQWYSDDRNLHISIYNISDHEVDPYGVGGKDIPGRSFSTENEIGFSMRIKPYVAPTRWVDWYGYKLYKEEVVPEQEDAGWMPKSFYTRYQEDELSYAVTHIPVVLTASNFATGSTPDASTAATVYQDLYKSSTSPNLTYDPIIPVYLKPITSNSAPVTGNNPLDVKSNYFGWEPWAQSTGITSKYGVSTFTSPDITSINSVYSTGLSVMQSNAQLGYTQLAFPFAISSGSTWTQAVSGLDLSSKTLYGENKKLTNTSYNQYAYNRNTDIISSFHACESPDVTYSKFISIADVVTATGAGIHHDGLGDYGHGCYAKSHEYINTGTSLIVEHIHPRGRFTNYFINKQMKWLSGYTRTARENLTNKWAYGSGDASIYQLSQSSKYPTDISLQYVNNTFLNDVASPILPRFYNNITSPRDDMLYNTYNGTPIDNYSDTHISNILTDDATLSHWSGSIVPPNWIEKCPAFQIVYSDRVVANDIDWPHVSNATGLFYTGGLVTGHGTYGQVLHQNGVPAHTTQDAGALTINHFSYLNRLSPLHVSSQYDTVAKPYLVASFDFTNGEPLPSSLTFSRSGTATYIDSDGLIQSAADGVARTYAYAPGGTVPGILMEGARTQVLTNAVWAGGTTPTSWTLTGSTPTVTSSTYGSSDGGIALRMTSSSSQTYLSQSVSLTSNTTYALSVYVEAVDGSATLNNILYAVGLPSGCTISSYLQNGSTSSGGTVAQVGRVTMILSGTYTGASATIRVGCSANTSVTRACTISRPQFEAATFPSSFIPSGSRNAETCYYTLSAAEAAILSVGGTMVVEWTPLHASTSDTATYPIAALFTTSASDCIRAFLYQTGINLLVNATGPGKTVDIFMSSVVTAHTKNKFAVTWASNSVNLAVGGSSGTRDVSAKIPSVATLLVGATSALGNIQGAIIHRITIYANSTASDTELTNLSTDGYDIPANTSPYIKDSETTTLYTGQWDLYTTGLVKKLFRLQSYNPDYIYHGQIEHPLETWSCSISSGNTSTIGATASRYPHLFSTTGDTTIGDYKIPHFVRRHRANDNLLIVANNWHSGQDTLTATFDPYNYDIDTSYQVYSFDVNSALHGTRTLLSIVPAGETYNISTTLNQYEMAVYEINTNSTTLSNSVFHNLKTNHAKIRYAYGTTELSTAHIDIAYNYGSTILGEITPPQIGYKSASTQQVLNNMPGWMRMRQDQDSDGWSLVNSWAMSLDQIINYVVLTTTDISLTTADPNRLSKLFYVDIDSTNILTKRTFQNRLFNSGFTIRDVSRSKMPAGWQVFDGNNAYIDYKSNTPGSLSVKSDTGKIKISQQVIFDNVLVDTLITSVYIHSNADTVDATLYVSVEKMDGTSVSSFAKLNNRSTEYTRLVLPIAIDSTVYRVNVSITTDCDGPVSIAAPQLETTSLTNWTNNITDYLPELLAVPRFNSVLAIPKNQDADIVPLYPINNEDQFIDVNLPTRVEKRISPQMDLSPYATQSYGRRVTYLGEVIDIDWTVLDDQIVERAVAPSEWDIYGRYDIRELRFFEDLIYGTRVNSDTTITPLVTAVRKDMVYVVCKEVEAGNTFYTLKLLRPRVPPNGETYLESIADFDLELTLGTSYGSNQITDEEITSIGFSDKDSTWMVINTSANIRHYYKLYFDYYFFSSNRNRLYTIEKYTDSKLSVT